MKKVLNNIKKWFKSHKKLSIILGVSLVIVIALIVSVSTIANIIMPDTRESVYGDRCATTEKYKVDSKKEEIAIKEKGLRKEEPLYICIGGGIVLSLPALVVIILVSKKRKKQ